MDLATGLANDKFEAMRDYLDKLTEINLEYAQVGHKEANSTFKHSVVTIAWVSGLAFILGGILMLLISRGVTGPFKPGSHRPDRYFTGRGGSDQSP